MSVASLSARAWLRYGVPLLVLAACAFAPLVLIALRLPAPRDAAQAKTVVRTAYALAGAGAVSLLVLVAGVAPAVRAIAAGRPRSQLAILGAGVVAIARALVPCALAVAAVVIGGLALVVPGVLVLALVSLTGASTEPTAAGRVADSVAIARTRIGAIALVWLATLAVYAVAIVLAQRGLVPVPKKPPPAQLAAYRSLVRVLVVGFAIAAPLPAVVLAAIHTRGARA